MKKLISTALALLLTFCLIPGITLAAEPGITITDGGHYDVAWGGDEAVFSVGWKYENISADDIQSIRVGAKDAQDRTVIEYTADAEQVAWQKDNGYITAEGLSSAPFYKEYNGTPIAEGRDLDWTVAKGEGFDTWQPTLFYVEVVTSQGTYYAEMNYDYPYPEVTITDGGHFDVEWGGDEAVFSVGWKYQGISADDIQSIRVGAKDAKDRTVIEYTADAEQAAWQKDNGYITAEGLSSAPFYKEYNGTPIAEGRDLDWTVAKGEGFDIWQPTLFYVEVVTSQGTYYDEMNYDYNYPHIHEAIFVPAKEATADEDGNIAYWYCPDCGKYFKDEALTQEITEAETIIAATGEETPAPSDSEQPSESTSPTPSGEPSDTATETSDQTVPKTGDDSSIGLWISLLAVAAGALIATVVVAKKRKAQ